MISVIHVQLSAEETARFSTDVFITKVRYRFHNILVSTLHDVGLARYIGGPLWLFFSPSQFLSITSVYTNLLAVMSSHFSTHTSFSVYYYSIIHSPPYFSVYAIRVLSALQLF